LTASVSGQNYPFARDFVAGVIIMKDSTRRPGLIKWFPAPGEKLIFREHENSSKQKYPPEELTGFNVDSFRFVSISDFEVYGNDYALLGKISKIKHTFGQRIDSGRINIYFVLFSGYNAFSGTIQSYPNYLFEKRTDSGFQYAAYPAGIRMKEKKYELAKQNLYVFFKDYPEVIDKIKSYKQEEDFSGIIRLVEKLN
jgi:hypothetical protein